LVGFVFESYLIIIVEEELLKILLISCAVIQT
jgi:hypothetical protein